MCSSKGLLRNWRETMKKVRMGNQQGFTLIELMIVIAIVGILAAIALPAYQDYTIRARMSEVLATAGEAKTTIAEFVAARGVMPSDGAAAGILLLGFGERSYVQSAEFVRANDDQGTYSILVSTSATDLGDAAGMTVNLEGQRDLVTGRVTWVCAPADATLAKFLPATCRGN
jgi:type IV pilus assembly protein PilA